MRFRKIAAYYAVAALMGVIVLMPMRASAASCDPSKTNGNPIKFLGLPTWYQYLPGETDPVGKCVPQISGCTVTADVANNTCIQSSGVDASKIWLIALAVLQFLLRIGGFIAFVMIIFSGFKYITSQGNPDATKAARQTIINAFIGMVISIIAAASVSFGVRLLQK